MVRVIICMFLRILVVFNVCVVGVGLVAWVWVSVVTFIICIVEWMWRMVSFVVFSVIVFLEGVHRVSLQLSMPTPRACVICAVGLLSFVVWTMSVVGVIGVIICLIPWRRSMIGVIRMTPCLIPTSAVGIVASFSRSTPWPSLSQVSQDVFRLYTDCSQ